MSRLDSAIRRLEAQRACLDRAAVLIRDLPGLVLELGLGNGRTFDHLRGLLPGRQIFVFDRQVAAHPDCVPAPDRLILGDLLETLPQVQERFARAVALVHFDLGSGIAEADRRLAAAATPALGPLLLKGAVVASDQPLATAWLRPLPLPDGVSDGRYHLYQATPSEV